MKRIFKYFLGFSIVFLSTCEKPERVVVIETGKPTVLGPDRATITGKIVDPGEGITQYGHCWSLTTNPVVTANSKTSKGSIYSAGNFTSEITDLDPGATYYVRAYAISLGETVYGNPATFITPEPPEAHTMEATNPGATSANLNGTVNANGQSTVVTFEYGPTTSYGSTITAVQSPLTGTANTNVSATISGLTPGTTYHFRVVAVNASGTTPGSDLTFSTLASTFNCGTSTVRDYDGNDYNTVKIGDQCWMKENLKVTHYSDGTAIPPVEGTSAWDVLGYTDKAYCYYDNSTTNRDIYGALYTWAAAMNGIASSDANPSGVQGICPVGWHLPSDAEWTELTNYLGGEGVAGGKLKETGTTHWSSPNIGATNETGFTALPGGDRGYYGTFYAIGGTGSWWSSTGSSTLNAWTRGMDYLTSYVLRYYYSKNYGFSVRCQRDPQ